jgi:hypothetical protein
MFSNRGRKHKFGVGSSEKIPVEGRFTLLRRKPRVFRPWMNVGRVPFEAPKERSRVCFGGFRPTKLVVEPRALARGSTNNVGDDDVRT